MERVQWVKHKNKDILTITYSGLKDKEEYVKAIAAATDEFVKKAVLKNRNPEKSVLLLIDVRESIAVTGVVDAFTESAKKAKPYVKKLAVVGIEGIRKFLLDTVFRFSGMSGKPFTEMAQAKDWLAE